MNADPLLRPFDIKGLRLKNRIMSTSHASGLDDHGMPGETYQTYHEEKARGGLALTMFGGSSFVAEDSTWPSAQLNVGTDRIIPFLQKFSTRVHGAGAAIMMQITHLGRRGEAETLNWLPTVAPSVVREAGHRSFPKEMDEHDISRVVQAFGDAAWRCKEGGLDGLETMVAGHLIGQFLSPVTNQRSDEFGGHLENRCRFGLMVMDEIRRRVGDDFLLGMRLSIDESTAGGMAFEDCLEMAGIFERSGLVDFFNVNYGRIDTQLSLVTDCMPGMASPIAPWLEFAGAFKREGGLPVFHAARITDLASARYAISEGLLDMVAMTRAHIADPQIVNKIKRGEEHRIRPCVGATHCMGDSRPTCIHNAAAGRERFWPQQIDATSGAKFKVVVVGGGPAGLEAARVCASRGHQVVLFEAASDLGGQLKLATRANWRKDIFGVVDWRVSELGVLGVTIHTDRYVDADDILTEQPDIVIMASGGQPQLDWLPGAEFCTSIFDLLSGNVSLQGETVIYDGTGRHPALVATDYLVNKGIKPELVLRDDQVGAELPYGDRLIWRRQLKQMDITLNNDYRLEGVQCVDDRLLVSFCHELTDQPLMMGVDHVVVEHGTIPVDEEYLALKAHSINQGITDINAFISRQPQPFQPAGNGQNFALYRIGDAISSRSVASAIFDALRLGCAI